mmetsp:Transcript_2656/g.8900  ORF Transcript_2656/g.8900 Transcript_2656/m.8900 type:complete len:86 (-) Transcript_2656:98-355(-)
MCKSLQKKENYEVAQNKQQEGQIIVNQKIEQVENSEQYTRGSQHSIKGPLYIERSGTNLAFSDSIFSIFALSRDDRGRSATLSML